MIQSVSGLTVFLLSAVSGLAAAPENARELATLRGHTNWVTGVAFSLDGQRLVTGSLDTTAKVWDLKTEAVLLTVPGHYGGIWSVAYSPDGRQFLTGGGDGDNNGKLWDANTGTLVQTYPRRTGGADWLESGPLRWAIAGHGQRVEVVAFSPDGKRVLTGSHDGRVIVWDATSGEPGLTLSPSGGSWIHAAVFSPDGGTIATGSYDGKLTLWDAQGGRELLALAGHTNAIESLAYFPDGGRIVTASYDKTARIWDATLGRELLALRGHQGPVTCVAVSPDGRRVVTGSTDRSARMWDTKTGQQLLLLKGHKDAIDAIAFSPDGRRVATTSLDRTIKIWDVTPAAGSVAPGTGAAVRLESDYIPLALRLKGDPANREMRSIRIAGKVPAEGDGEGEIWLDTRLAELNAFGDVVERLGPEPDPIRVQLRYVSKGVAPAPIRDSQQPSVGATSGFKRIDPTQSRDFLHESKTSQGFRLYELVFPGGLLSGRLKLVLGTAILGPHRLLANDVSTPATRQITETCGHIVPLHGDPAITSVLPDAPLGQGIDLTGLYTGVDGRIQRLGMRGKLGGAGALEIDPNFITFDPFGEPVMFTCIGYPHHEIALKPAEETDPLGQARKLYWAVSKDSRNTNRVAVVLGRSEIGPHRILLYRGDQVAFIVPAHLADRRRQEIAVAEFAILSPGEQQAIAELRRTTGYGFHCQIEKGQAIALSFTDDTGRSLPEGVLARLPHLQSIEFRGGRIPAVWLADLGRLAQLRSVHFSSTEFQPTGMAMLKDLGQLESLTFYGCRGITDAGVRHLTGLTRLRRLSFYTEAILDRPAVARTSITDAGVAHLKGLVRLEHLDLFGHDVSDASVKSLSAMTELQTLALSGHGWTDAGLKELARLPKLRELRLFETAVTTNGVANLKARLPKLQIQAWDRNSSG